MKTIRLRTTKNAEDKINEIQHLFHLTSKAAVMRLAIAYSLLEESNPISSNEYETNFDGAEYNRYTIYGENEIIYLMLFQEHLHQHIDDETFFPVLTSAHIERGVSYIKSEFDLHGSVSKVIDRILYGGIDVHL